MGAFKQPFKILRKAVLQKKRKRDFASFLMKFSPEEYKQAAVDYPNRLEGSNRHYLYTKPFDCTRERGTSAELFHGFASLLSILDLPPRAEILDVACGPGWLSEYMARSGYDVTGIDISPSMIKIAKERIESIQFGPDKDRPLKARFFTGDAETMETGHNRYHAAVFYDSLHHFPDQEAVLHSVYTSLRPGGRLFIKEGTKPPEGSEGEKNLMDTIIKYGTLESPLGQPELFSLLRKVGFLEAQAYEFVNAAIKRNGNRMTPALNDVPVPETNTILAYKPGPKYDSQIPNVLKGRIDCSGQQIPQQVMAGSDIKLTLFVKNIGDTLWLSKKDREWGFITIGTKLQDRQKNFLSDRLARTALSGDVPPGGAMTLTHCFTAPKEAGEFWIKLDLVDEDVIWFEELGSQPFEFFLQVKT